MTRLARFPAMKHGGWVYMTGERYRGAHYTGVTACLPERIEDAITREKAIKKWRRAWKIELIDAMNPDWDDLYERINW